MANGETPGIGGVPGFASPQTRAPKAWNQMLLGFYQDLPDGLRRSAKARRGMLLVGSRRRKVR